MRKLIFVALLASAATVAATPALAQENAPFSGVRVQGIVGYDRTHTDGVNSDGVAYGAQVGYDFQAGNLVLGVEGEAGDSTVDECANAVIVATDELCVNAGRDLYAGGRVGYALSPRVLLFGKAGYTNARVSLDYQDGTVATAPDFSIRDHLDGVRVGGGLEFALGPNAYLSTEYRYSNYEQGFERHQVVAGLGFRF